MEVMETGHHLMEICSGDFLRELSCITDIIKELSSATVLEDDGKALVGMTIFSLISSYISDSNKLDNILLVKVFHDGKFVNEGLKVRCLSLVSLDGHKLSL